MVVVGEIDVFVHAVVFETGRRGEKADDLHLLAAGVVQHVDGALRKQDGRAGRDRLDLACDHHAAGPLMMKMTSSPLGCECAGRTFSPGGTRMTQAEQYFAAIVCGLSERASAVADPADPDARRRLRAGSARSFHPPRRRAIASAISPGVNGKPQRALRKSPNGCTAEALGRERVDGQHAPQAVRRAAPVK